MFEIKSNHKVCDLLFGDQSETEFRVVGEKNREKTYLERVHFVLLQMRGCPHDASQ